MSWSCQILWAYYTTYSVQAAFRSRIQSVQLVSLIRSKFWKNHGNSKANERLLTDLKQLETDGIVINKPTKRIVRAGLAVFVGDNLGLRQLGEYNACFSSGFICRVCTAKYSETCVNLRLYSGVEEGYEPELFSEDAYDKFADIAFINRESNAESCGLKAHCLFNSFQSYHCSSD